MPYRSETSLSERIVKGFAWEGGTKLVIQILSWVSTFIVARILTPEDYGVVAVSGVFVGMLAVMVDFGLTDGLINKRDITEEEEDAVYWLSISVGLVSYGLLFLVAPVIAELYAIPELKDIMRTAGLILIMASLNVVPIAMAMRRLDFRYKALVEMVGQAVSIVVVIALAFGGYGAWSLVWSFLALQLVSVIAYMRLLRRIPRFSIRIAKVREVVAFGGSVMLSRVLEVATHKADVFVIGLLLGQKAVGYYTLALHLAMLPMEKIGSVFNRIAFPTLSKIKDDGERCRNMVLNLHRYLLLLVYPILVVLIVASGDVITLLLGDGWRPAAPILQVLAAVNLVRVSGMLFPYALNGRGRPDLVLRYQLVAVIILPIGFFLGAKVGGLYGVAYSWFFCYPVIYGVLLRYMWRQYELNWRYYFGSLAPALAGGVVMAICLEVMLLQGPAEDYRYLGIATAVTAGMVVYMLMIALVYREGVSEMRRGLGILRGREEVVT